MPGFLTHYFFGVSTFRHADRHIFYNLIKKHPGAYALGLQGPDLFFYYPPGYRFCPNPASAAHSGHTTEFLNALLKSRRLFEAQEDYETVLCYLFGFLGHYTLDSICHPYIYDKTHFTDKTPAYYGRHVYLETDIDKVLLRHYKGLLPSEFPAADTIRLSGRERSCLARSLRFAYRRTFPEIRFTYADTYLATVCMPLAISLLRDPSGKKKALVRRIERHIPGYAYASPLIASDTMYFTKDPLNLRRRKWKNPWKPSEVSTDSFPMLYQKAQTLYLKRIRLLELVIEADITTGKAWYSAKEVSAVKHFKDSLGNLSYSSGLPVNR